MTSRSSVDAFPHEWRAEVLAAPPLIAPARQFTYPHQVAGEEDALARGALLVLIHPAAGGGDFLATCALGFSDPSMPTGIFSCPNSRELCAVAGGYAYVIDTTAPERSTHIPVKPCAQPAGLRGLSLAAGVGGGWARLADGSAELGGLAHRRRGGGHTARLRLEYGHQPGSRVHR
jgi:hypothetical protein